MEARVLVGRGRELEAVASVLSRVASGERVVAMITGEPGIGKTRLLEELAARMRAAGGAVGWGRAAEVGITPAFWPWIQVLAALEGEGDRAPSLASADRARMRQGGWRGSARSRRSSPARRGPADRDLLDDVHAADPSSLQLLEDVLPVLARTEPVLVALGARDADADREIQAALGRLQRGAVRLPLGRARRGRRRGARRRSRADSARVYELSEGNPLFVEELLAAARRAAAAPRCRACVR